MRKLYLLMLCILLAHASQTNAQCTGGRYWNEIFPTVNMTTVTYSTVYGQAMDIYQPAGDTCTSRPVIILGHGGSFITGNGDRTNDSTIIWLCKRFAMRGYVTVSIDYRTTDILSMLDSNLAKDEVAKAMSDGKAAIRFFVQDRATSNTYKIDTNNIYVGGNSAGAVLYMHVGYVDSMGELPPNIATAVAANGGYEGNSGNAGYTTRFRGIINLAGGLNKSYFIGPGNRPSCNAQGDTDVTVPYHCGYPLSGAIHVTLCGMGVLESVMTANGINHMTHVFPGDGHVPWASNAAKFNTVDSMVRVFLYNFVCPGVNAVEQVATNTEVMLFPNPAGELVNLHTDDAVSEVTVYDQTGRAVFSSGHINATNYEINTSHLAKGLYFVKVRFGNDNSTPVVKRLAIE